jgi:hypothetical protein
MQRKLLSEILPKADRDRLAEAWDSTDAADDLGPLPPGEYRCRIIDGRVFTAKTGTPGYKITFEIIDGEHAHRRAWFDIWLSPAAMGIAKRELFKVGITRLDQLEQPIPSGMLATIRVVLHRDDDGTERSRVKVFKVTGVEQPEPEPFAPTINGEPSDSQTTDAEGFDWRSGRQTEGEGTMP